MSDKPKLEPQPVVVTQESEKDLFSWKAPLRPFKRRNREFWLSVIAASALFGFILFIAEGTMPVILLIAIVFLFYILSTVEPEEIQYKITNKGVKIGDEGTGWPAILRFWFTKRLEVDLLVLETLSLPGRFEFVINSKDKEQIKKTLSKYVVYEELPASGIDKLTEWASKKFPGNK